MLVIAYNAYFSELTWRAPCIMGKILKSLWRGACFFLIIYYSAVVIYGVIVQKSKSVLFFVVFVLHIHASECSDYIFHTMHGYCHLCEERFHVDAADQASAAFQMRDNKAPLYNVEPFLLGDVPLGCGVSDDYDLHLDYTILAGQYTAETDKLECTNSVDTESQMSDTSQSYNDRSSLYNPERSSQDDSPLECSDNDDVNLCSYNNALETYGASREVQLRPINSVAAVRRKGSDKRLLCDMDWCDKVCEGIDGDMTPLMHAADIGNVEDVEKYLEAFAKRQTSNHMTALMCAAIKGHMSCVELLVPYELRMQNKKGMTALMYAAAFGHYACIYLLLDEVCLYDEEGHTALMYAVVNKHNECVRLLLEETKMQDGQGKTALMYAAFLSLQKPMLLLLNELSMRDRQGRTALMHYVVKRPDRMTHTQRLSHAMILGKEVLVCDSKGNTVLHYTQESYLVDYLQSIMQANQKDSSVGNIASEGQLDGVNGVDATIKNGCTTPLMRAAESGNVEDLQKYFQRFMKCQNADGMTALMYAAIKGHVSCVELLARNECGIQDNDGMTALMYAAQFGHRECMRLLLREVGKKNNRGQTAVMHFISKGCIGMYGNKRFECIMMLRKELLLHDNDDHSASFYMKRCASKRLLERIIGVLEKCRGSARPKQDNSDLCTDIVTSSAEQCGNANDVFAAHQEGDVQQLQSNNLHSAVFANEMTPLMSAAKLGNVEDIKKYLAEFAGRQTAHNMTALMYAAKSGHASCVKCLLYYELCVQDDQGKTALMYAVESQAVDCVMLLMGEATMQDKQCMTALMYAVKMANVDCIKLLFYESGMQDKQGKTALMHAVSIPDKQDCRLEIVRILANTELKKQDNKGKTALMYAVKIARVDYISLLLGEIGMKDHKGKTAFRHIMYFRFMRLRLAQRLDMIRMLDQEFDVCACDNRTACSYGYSNKQKKLQGTLKLLRQRL